MADQLPPDEQNIPVVALGHGAKRLRRDGRLYRAKTVGPPGLAAALLAQHAVAREAAAAQEAAAQEAAAAREAAEPGPRLRKKPKIDNAFTLLVPDLAYNKETIGIPVSGPSGFPPPKFKYITEMVYDDDVEIPQPIGCQCHRGGCRAATTCRCLFLNTNQPYDRHHRLQVYRALIFECNKNCKCIDKCLLRSSQQQIPQLEVFLSSEQKGWGVRSPNRIPKGTLVCEYLGYMRRFEHAHNNTKYGFDISCLRVIREIAEEDGLPSGYKLALPDESEEEFDVGFNIDADHFGNIARFINHSCEANVFAQCIAYHSEDMTLSAKSARIMLFAERDIDADEEITLDYHSAGPNEVECLCGAENSVEEEPDDQIDLSCFSGNLWRDNNDKGRDCWTISEGNNFRVRSKHFCYDKTKIPAGKHLMDLVAVDWFKDTKRMDHVVRRQGCAAQVASEKGLFSIVFNLQVPGSTHYSMVFYFVTKELVPGSLLQRFVDGDDEFRTSRLKLIPSVPKGSWIVRQSVGSTPCLLGKAVDCNYIRGPKYLEIDVDIGSSTVANGVLGLVTGVITTLVVDMAFLVQANTTDELPERLIGAVRVSHIELRSAIVPKLEVDPSPS